MATPRLRTPEELAIVALTRFGIDASDTQMDRFIRWVMANHKTPRGRPRNVPSVVGTPGYMRPYLPFDYLRTALGLNNDSALAQFLDYESAIISKIRAGKANLTPAVIIRIYEKTGMSIEEIQELLCHHTSSKP